jgi:hypothetical protein
MKRPDSASSIYFRLCTATLFFLLAAASFGGFYTKWHFREAGVPGGAGLYGDQRYGLAEILDGTAARPYVYSQFIPTVANWLDRTVPQSTKDWIYGNIQDTTPIQNAIATSKLAGDPKFFFRYWTVYTLIFLSAWLAVVAMYLVCKALGAPRLVCLLAPSIVILLFPWIETLGGYFYDYPDLAFLALAVWISLRYPWWLLIPVVALGAWNRESFILIIPALYPLLRQRTSRPQAITAIAAMAVTGIAVIAGLYHQFHQNYGFMLASRWRVQLSYFVYPAHYFKMEATYGIPFFRLYSVIPYILMVWTVWRGWRRLPKVIQRHAQLAAAMSFPYCFLFCMPAETRELSALYIALLLIIAVHLTPREEQWT